MSKRDSLEVPSINLDNFDESKVIKIQSLYRGRVCRAEYGVLKKLFEKRTKLVQELLATEETYVASLQLLCSTYVKAVRQANPEVLNAKSRAALFGSAEDILAINLTLLEALRERINVGTGWNNNTSLVGDAMYKLIPYLKIYRNYCSNYHTVIETVATKLNNESSAFAQLISKVHTQNREDGHKQDLPSLLIQPVQRIPRYKLLMDELVKLTPLDHPDADSLALCSESFASLADSVNESIRSRENFEKLVQLKRSFATSMTTFPIIVPGRRFLLEADLMKMCRKGPKKRRFILFSDVLAYASQSDVPGASAVLLKPNFLSLSNGVRVKPGAEPTQFVVISRQKSFVVIADSVKQQQQWTKAISDAVLEFASEASGSSSYRSASSRKSDRSSISSVSNRYSTSTIDSEISAAAAAAGAGAGGGAGTGADNETADGEDGEQFKFSDAPLWVPDFESKACMICSTTFTMIRRRHHCRSCGHVVCGSCSSHKAFLRAMVPGSQSDPGVRVCDECFKRIPARRRRCCSQSKPDLIEGDVPAHKAESMEKRFRGLLKKGVAGPAASTTDAATAQQDQLLHRSAADEFAATAAVVSGSGRFVTAADGADAQSADVFLDPAAADDDDPFATAPAQTQSDFDDVFGEPPSMDLPTVPGQ